MHYLADCLKAAKCKSPLDMDRIRLCLQGYNYGNGYIPWAIKRDGGYTVANAIAFSNMQARWLIECGLLLCYDDKRNSKHE